MSTALRHAVGSLFVVGLEARELSALERAWLGVLRPGGIILFRRNIESAPQTRSLLEDATTLCAPHALRCVDMEGGTVDRLRNALAPTVAAQLVARTARPALMQQHGELIARASRAFGFNTVLAPVLDLALPASADVMTTRAAAPTAEGVVAYAHAVLTAFQQHGLLGCGKHFPGLGGGTLDSHHATPSIDRTLRTLRAEDIAPYVALRRELPLIMISHASYPRTPSRKVPASVAPFWITKVLRKQIGYRGVLFSDDLEMGGILQYMPIEQAAISAFRAGIDLIEICHSPALILRAYEAVLAEAERSPAFAHQIQLRARRLARLRAARAASAPNKPLTPTQLERLRQQMLAFAARPEFAQ